MKKINNGPVMGVCKAEECIDVHHVRIYTPRVFHVISPGCMCRRLLFQVRLLSISMYRVMRWMILYKAGVTRVWLYRGEKEG